MIFRSTWDVLGSTCSILACESLRIEVFNRRQLQIDRGDGCKVGGAVVSVGEDSRLIFC